MLMNTYTLSDVSAGDAIKSFHIVRYKKSNSYTLKLSWAFLSKNILDIYSMTEENSVFSLSASS